MSFLFEQQPLALQLRDDATFDNYYAADNAILVAQLRRQLEGDERYIYIHGANGSGRSHLLQAACHRADQLAMASVYLPLQALQDYSAQELFDGLERVSLVCLDDIHCVAGKPQWEQPLFNVFNRLAEHRVCLLVAGDCAVRELNIQLADLASRLSWASVYHIKALTDAQRIGALQFRAEKRGLQMNDEVAQFIYHRCRRDTETLLDVLGHLDNASLKQQRRLTIPFVKSIMKW